MPCLITARCAIKKITRKKIKRQKQKIHGKSQYLNSKAPSNNIKLQSENP